VGAPALTAGLRLSSDLPDEAEAIGKLTTDPHLGEPGSRAKLRQLDRREPAADGAPVPLVEQRTGRDLPEDANSEIGHPVPFDIGGDHSGGGETSPLVQQPLRFPEGEVVEQHRGDDVVERFAGERRLPSIRADDVDLGPVTTGRGGVADNDRIVVDGHDAHPHAVGASPGHQNAGDVAAPAAEVQHADGGGLSRLEQRAERTEHATCAAEVAVGDPEVVERLDRPAAGASERVRPLSGFQTDHPSSSPWRGHRPGFTRPLHIVISDRSGRGAAAAIGARLADALRSNAYPVQVRRFDDFPRTRAHLVRDARNLACLIGVGGDHTLSELARVAHEARVPLLPVPAGFGNIFAGAFGLRPTVAAVTETLERGCVKLVDVGLCGDDLFLANLGFGFLEQVKLAVETSATIPRRRGHRYRSYLQAAVRSIARAPLPTLQVDVDGRRIADRTPFAIVANVPTYRTFMPLIPDASPFDGLLDVFVAPEMSKSGLVAWLLGLLVRAPLCRRAAVRRRAAQVSIRDGDRTNDLVVVPRAVPVLLPSD
jgi:diacylglycerol kinase (ATP)